MEAEKSRKESTPHRPHRGWVRLLIGLVGFLTVLAILSTWVDRQVFNTDQWGVTSVELLKNPEIQGAVANYAVDELYAKGNVEGELKKILPVDLKDLSGVAAGGLRQVADQGAKKALENPRVQALWQRANEAAHKTLIDVLEDRSQVLRTSGGQVRLELRPLIIEIASQVGLGKQAEQNIPASVGNVNILDSSELKTAQQVTKVIHGLALVTSLLALALLLLAVGLSTGYRWSTLIWLGVTLIIAAVVVLILRSVAGGFVVDNLADVDIQPAASAAWNIGTDLLRSMAMTVFWSSLVLFVLAWLASPTRPAEQVRRFLSVPLGRFPWPVFGLFALVAFVFLITGVGDSRVFLMRLMLVVAAALGLWFARRQLLQEYPDESFDGLRDFGAKTADSARAFWDGPVRGATRIFGSRGSDGAEGEVAASAAPPTDEQPTKQLEGKSSTGEPEAPTRVLPTGEADRFEQLERLGKLKESGVLTDEEFAAEKQRILGRE